MTNQGNFDKRTRTTNERGEYQRELRVAEGCEEESMCKLHVCTGVLMNYISDKTGLWWGAGGEIGLFILK